MVAKNLFLTMSGSNSENPPKPTTQAAPHAQRLGQTPGTPITAENTTALHLVLRERVRHDLCSIPCTLPCRAVLPQKPLADQLLLPPGSPESCRGIGAVTTRFSTPPKTLTSLRQGGTPGPSRGAAAARRPCPRAAQAARPARQDGPWGARGCTRRDPGLVLSGGDLAKPKARGHPGHKSHAD